MSPSYRPTLVSTILLVAVVISPGVAEAGPWVPGFGEAYVKASGSHFNATGVYDRQGNETDPNYEYSHYAARLYLDVGIAPHLGLSATAPFMVSKNTQMTDSGEAKYVKRGMGDLDLALQSGTILGPVALSGVAEFRVPLYSETISADSPTPTAFTEEELDRRRFLPALGDGSNDLTLLAQAGLSLHPVPAWITASIGPKFRFQGFGHGLEYALSAGAFVWPDRLALQTRIGGIKRFSGGNERPTKSYLQISGGPIVRIAGPVSFEATAGYIPTGAFVSRGWSVSAGVSYDGRIFPNPLAGDS
jgi:hypothetical protein